MPSPNTSTAARAAAGQPQPRSSDGAATTDSLHSASDRDWLTPGRIAALNEQNKRLNELLGRQTEEILCNDLAMVMVTVRSSEEEIEAVERLVQKSRVQGLSSAEWRELCRRHYQGQLDLRVRSGQIRGNQKRLMQRGMFWGADQRLVDDLLHRFDNVTEFWQSHRSAWLHGGRLLHASLPLHPDKRVSVESHLVPGTALGTHFVGGYPAQENREGLAAARYANLPGLALTALTDDQGQLLYVGLRHELSLAGELDEHRLKSASDREIKALADALYEPVVMQGSTGAARERFVDDFCKTVRNRPDAGPMLALSMRTEAYRMTAKQMTAAALVADPRGLGAALRGTPQPFGINAIALLSPEDVPTWCAQVDCFKSFQDKPGITGLDMLDWSGKPRAVDVVFHVRRFALPTVDDAANWKQCRDINRDAVRCLLGRLDSPRLGGDIKAVIDARQAGIENNSQKVSRLRSDYRKMLRERGPSDQAVDSLRKTLGLLDQSLREDRKSVCMLRTGGAQLKALLTPDGDWPAGASLKRKAAARLALIGFCMRETSMLSGPRGRDLVGAVEAEVRFLATVAAHDGGRLPEVDLDMKVWGNARAAFEWPAPRAAVQAQSRQNSPSASTDYAPRQRVSATVVGGACGKTHFNADMLHAPRSPTASRQRETDDAGLFPAAAGEPVTLELD